MVYSIPRTGKFSERPICLKTLTKLVRVETEKGNEKSQGENYAE